MMPEAVPCGSAMIRRESGDLRNMAIPLSRTRQYCTTAETELVLWSTLKRVGELTPARLRQKIDRARKLRDKYRDLAAQQRRESRGKDSPRGKRASQSNEATVLKQQIFAEALERFEKALAKADTGAARPAGQSKKVLRAKSRRASAAAGESNPQPDHAAKNTSSSARGRTRRKPVKSKNARSSKPVGKAKAAVSKKRGVPQDDSSKKEAAEQATRIVQFAEKVISKLTQRQVNKSGATRHKAHVSSRTRRSQARRDSRGAGG